MRRVAALAGAEYLVAHIEFWGPSLVRGDGEHDAGEFGTGNPGESGLVLVFAPDLEEVEEVGCGGVDGDQVLGGIRSGRWEGVYGEVLWALFLNLLAGTIRGGEEAMVPSRILSLGWHASR